MPLKILETFCTMLHSCKIGISSNHRAQLHSETLQPSGLSYWRIRTEKKVFFLLSYFPPSPVLAKKGDVCATLPAQSVGVDVLWMRQFAGGGNVSSVSFGDASWRQCGRAENKEAGNRSVLLSYYTEERRHAGWLSGGASPTRRQRTRGAAGDVSRDAREQHRHCFLLCFQPP